jgi:GxxExxY protein
MEFTMTKLIHENLTYTTRGILFNVYNTLGPMLPEAFYQKAVIYGLRAKGITCEAEKNFEVYYRGERVGLYRVDIWIEGGKLVLELKVAPKILPLHKAQAISYLKVTDADLAIVVNFGAASLETERLPNFLRNKVVDFEWEKRPLPKDALYPELTNRLFEILHRVHLELRPGFLHQVYRRSAMIELRHQGLRYDYIKQIPIVYQGHNLGMQDVRLIRVEDKVLLATFAVKQVTEAIKETLKARLKHLGLQLGLLANFNSARVEIVVVRRGDTTTD